MAGQIDPEELRTALVGLRNDISQLSPSLAKSSSWSAHANWKSSSSSLMGDYSLSSQLRQPADAAAQLEALAQQSTSERFLEVTRSLAETLQSARR